MNTGPLEKKSQEISPSYLEKIEYIYEFCDKNLLIFLLILSPAKSKWKVLMAITAEQANHE